MGRRLRRWKNAVYILIAAVLLYLFWLDFWIALCATGTAFLLALPLLGWLEPRLIFYPHVPTRRIETKPQHSGFENVSLTAEDGTLLNAWWLPCTTPDALTVLFFHGNAGNISHRVERTSTFHNLGANLLLLDYRGYGQSEGRPSEAGTYLDSFAAYDWVIERGVSPQQVILYGESLGTAVAIELATRVSCGGIVLETPFTSVVDVARRMLPLIPVRFLVRNRYESLSKIARVEAPVLIFRAREDEKFAPQHAQQIFEAASAPKWLVELRGAHSDAFQVSAALHQQSLKDFFAYVRQNNPSSAKQRLV